MTFRQGAMALVLAGLLSGCVAGGSSSTSAPKPAAGGLFIAWCRAGIL
ncbi:hypothetical protein ACLAIO_07395 [Klebsiella pneumoniae]